MKSARNRLENSLVSLMAGNPFPLICWGAHSVPSANPATRSGRGWSISVTGLAIGLGVGEGRTAIVGTDPARQAAKWAGPREGEPSTHRWNQGAARLSTESDHEPATVERTRTGLARASSVRLSAQGRIDRRQSATAGRSGVCAGLAIAWRAFEGRGDMSRRRHGGLGQHPGGSLPVAASREAGAAEGIGDPHRDRSRGSLRQAPPLRAARAGTGQIPTRDRRCRVGLIGRGIFQYVQVGERFPRRSDQVRDDVVTAARPGR